MGRKSNKRGRDKRGSGSAPATTSAVQPVAKGPPAPAKAISQTILTQSPPAPDKAAPAAIESSAPITAIAPPAAPAFVDEGIIARGGHASIHRIYEPDLSRHVAMKRLDPRLAREDRAAVESFFEEARLTGQLEHPNIPPVHKIGVDPEGNAYFTMKLVEGRTLESLLAEGEFSPANEDALFEILSVFIKICDAVAFAHSRGVIHRDLKPDNIMVGTHGQVYVMDWGVAKLLGASAALSGEREAQILDTRGQSMEERGKLVGTLEYMPPEQAETRTDDIDERSDVFALGAILYRILAGRPPYQAPTPVATLVLAMKAEIPHPQDLVAGVTLPARLAAIALRALSKDKEARYPTVEALKADVESYLRGPGRFPTEDFEAGTLILREGEPGDRAYIILKGVCRVYKTIHDRRLNLVELGPGAVFGEAALFTQQPRTASVEALTEMSAAVVTRQSIVQELGRTAWLGPLVNAMAERFRDVDRRATRLALDEEQVKLTMGVLYYMNFFGEAVEPGRREAPWAPLRRQLAKQFSRTEPQIEEMVERVAEIRIDRERDRVLLSAMG